MISSLKLFAVVCVTSLLVQASASAQPLEFDDGPSVAQPVVVAPIKAESQPAAAPGARDLTLTERLLLRQQWMQYREHDRREIKVVGPSVAGVLGLGALSTSIWLMTRDVKSQQVGGALLSVFVALPLVVVSTVVLAKRVKQRRAISHEIWSTTPVSASGLAFRF